MTRVFRNLIAFAALTSFHLLSSDTVAFAASNAPTISQLRQLGTNEENQQAKIRDEEILQIRTTLGRRKGENRSVEMYHRLSELYYEEYRSLFVLEGKFFEQAIEGDQQGKTSVKFERTVSKQSLRLARQAVAEAISLQPNHPKADRSYILLGFYDEELDDIASAEKDYQTVLKRFSSSPVLAEAYFRLAEISYFRSDYRNAEIQYEEAIKRKLEPELLVRAKHRQAWCQYRQRKYDQAIETLKSCVETAKEDKTRFFAIRDELLRDLALFYTERNRVNDAIEYFKQFAADDLDYSKILEKLGRQFERSAQSEKAAQVYNAVVELSKEDEQSIKAKIRLIDLDLRRGKYRDAHQKLTVLKVPAKPTPEVESDLKSLQALVRKTAVDLHSRFRQSGNREALEWSEKLYEYYLSKYVGKEDESNKSERAEVMMYLAEVKRETGKPAEASGLYREVVDLKDPRYSKEAGLLWAGSLVEAIKKDDASRKDRKSLTVKEKELVAAVDTIADSLGDLPEVRELNLKVIQVLASYPEQEEVAIQRAKKQIDRFPNSAQAVIEARLILQLKSERVKQSTLSGSKDVEGSLNELKELIASIKGNAELMKADQNQGGKLRDLLADLDVRLKVGEIAVHESKKDFSSAGEGYEQFALSEKDPLASEKAFSSAVDAYVKANQFSKTKEVILKWIKKLPKTESRALEKGRIAATHSLIEGDYASASDLFSIIGEKKRESSALILSGQLDLASQSYSESIKRNEQLFTLYPTFAGSASVRMDIAEAALALGDHTKYEKTLKQCQDAEKGEAGQLCAIRLGQYFETQGKTDSAKAVYKQLSSLPSKTIYVGFAKYKMGEFFEKSISLKSIDSIDEGLKESLDRRIEQIASIQKNFSSAVEHGGSAGLQAISRIVIESLMFAEDIDRLVEHTKEMDSSGSALTGAKLSKVSQLESLSKQLKAKALVSAQEAYSLAVKERVLSPSLSLVSDLLVFMGSRNPGLAQMKKPNLKLASGTNQSFTEGTKIVSKDTSLSDVREKLHKNPKDPSLWLDLGNLLFFDQKPKLANFVFEYVMGLEPKSGRAYNNRAVVEFQSNTDSVGFGAHETKSLIEKAMQLEPSVAIYQVNYGFLTAYFRQFAESKGIWDRLGSDARSNDDRYGQEMYAWTSSMFLGLREDGNAKDAIQRLKQATNGEGFNLQFSELAFDLNITDRSMMSKTRMSECASNAAKISVSDIGSLETATLGRVQSWCETGRVASW